MTDSDVCCGFGGTFSVNYADISSAMADEKVDNIVATGADYVVGCDMSCLMNIQGPVVTSRGNGSGQAHRRDPREYGRCMMKKPDSPDYREGARRGLASESLQKNLKTLQNRFGRGAFKEWAALADPGIRDRVKERRMDMLEHLDVVLALLADKVEQNGGRVFFAKTAEEAVNYCVEVARNGNVKTIVKGKSMVSAEIGVDAALHNEGIEVVETDLGEYIVQLREEVPSHIVAPSVHLNRQQVGRLFTDKLGIPYSEDPPTLTMAARKALRRKMLSADMGISGCNIACAETGRIALVSNEGNIRMATTMPRIHVALMGIERVEATLANQLETLQLLTKAATQQKLSGYVSFSGGPRQPGDIDGPEEFHLVMIDNGRSKILADPEFREVLACLRCGACLNVCPVYGRIGGHAYNSIYSGPVGAVLTPLLYGVNRMLTCAKGKASAAHASTSARSITICRECCWLCATNWPTAMNAGRPGRTNHSKPSPSNSGGWP